MTDPFDEAINAYAYNELFASKRPGKPRAKSPRTGSAKRPRLAALVHKTYGRTALERNRTVDLILTMDMLCQLSYKGILRSVGTIAFTRRFVKLRPA